MGRLKTATLTLTLAGACGYSLFQKLQWPAVLSLALLAALLYRQYTSRIIEACLAIINIQPRISKGTSRSAKRKQIGSDRFRMLLHLSEDP